MIRYSRRYGRFAASAAAISRSTGARSSGWVTDVIVCFVAPRKSAAAYPVIVSISSLTRWLVQSLSFAAR